MKDQMRDGNSLAFLYHDINELEHSKQINLPRVSVVMPLKGFGEHNLHNWRTQVNFSMDNLISPFLDEFAQYIGCVINILLNFTIRGIWYM